MLLTFQYYCTDRYCTVYNKMLRSILFLFITWYFFWISPFFLKCQWIFPVTCFTSDIGNEFLNLSWKILMKTLHFMNNWPTLPWQALYFWELSIQKAEKLSFFFASIQHMLYQMFHWEDKHADQNKLPHEWSLVKRFEFYVKREMDWLHHSLVVVTPIRFSWLW